MTLLILAAGLGSRYGGLKQLDPMTDGGNFIIDFSVYDAIQAGFDRVVFLVKRENLELFRETIGHRIEKKVRVEYAFQDLDKLPAGLTLPAGRVKPWGTGHAVYCAADVVGNDRFAVINADDFYGRDTFFRLAEHLKKPGLEAGTVSENGKRALPAVGTEAENRTLPSGDGQKQQGNTPEDRKRALPAQHCMVGFRLGNTLTENGTVSRGECRVKNGLLDRVTERTKIEKREKDAAYLAEDGTWKPLPFDTIVSMNCWGFTSDFFADLERGFRAFWKANESDLSKCEYYLPTAVQEQKDDGKCDVRVYSTPSQWLGVTYPEDKARVKAAIAELIAKGEYPADLWA